MGTAKERRLRRLWPFPSSRHARNVKVEPNWSCAEHGTGSKTRHSNMPVAAGGDPARCTERRRGENDMKGLINTRRAAGTIGIAMDDETLVRTLARILSCRGLEVAIFNRTDVMSGAWPVLPYTVCRSEPSSDGTPPPLRPRRCWRPARRRGARHPTILALPRGAIARHRDKIADRRRLRPHRRIARIPAEPRDARRTRIERHAARRQKRRRAGEPAARAR